MRVNDDTIESLQSALAKADDFLRPLARGNGFDKAAFEGFARSLQELAPRCQQLPKKLKECIVSLLEIPSLMDNSTGIVSANQRDDLVEATIKVIDLSIELFSSPE